MKRRPMTSHFTFVVSSGMFRMKKKRLLFYIRGDRMYITSDQKRTLWNKQQRFVDIFRNANFFGKYFLNINFIL